MAAIGRPISGCAAPSVRRSNGLLGLLPSKLSSASTEGLDSVTSAVNEAPASACAPMKLVGTMKVTVRPRTFTSVAKNTDWAIDAATSPGAAVATCCKVSASWRAISSGRGVSTMAFSQPCAGSKVARRPGNVTVLPDPATRSVSR